MEKEQMLDMITRISSKMYESPNKVLHVIADLNGLASHSMHDLMNSYQERAKNAVDKEAEPPKPSDFVLGFLLFSLAHYEFMTKKIMKEGAEENLRGFVLDIINKGAGRIIGQMMREAGVTEEYLGDDLSEYRKSKGI